MGEQAVARNRPGSAFPACGGPRSCLAGIGSVIGYAAISATINGEPSTSPFQGFVALLQAAGSFSRTRSSWQQPRWRPAVPASTLPWNIR